MSLNLSIAAALLVLWLPIAVTFWFRNKALAAPVEARTSVWFWCFRFLRYLNIGTLTLWWVATDSLGLKSPALVFWLQHVSHRIPLNSTLFLLSFWIPPIAVLILCHVLFQPVYRQVREIDWTHVELARQAAFSLGSSLVPILCVAGGLSQLDRPDWLSNLALSFFLALFFLIVCRRALVKQLKLTPYALTTGELRDRAFALAGQLGVKLQQIFLLPPGKSRLANAFARSGSMILFTETLLSNLSKREVDFVIAHELSHLKHDHPRYLGWALGGGFGAVAGPYFIFRNQVPEFQPLFELLLIVVPLLAYYFVARRFEYVADAGSVRLTGDPAAAITSLVRLHQLNRMPLEWSKWGEKTMTHPSTLRRAGAIGRVAGMTEARVTELLSMPASNSAESVADRYPIPPHAAAAGKVFSTRFKHSIASRSYFGLLVLAIVLPAAALRALDVLGFSGTGFLAFFFGLVLCLAFVLLFANFVPFRGYRALSQGLRAKLAADGVPAPSENAVLVGLSPGDGPRIFDANYAWDAGYLMLFADRLCYWGEETRFALRREQIASVEIGPGIPGWFRSKFLYITCQAAEGQRQFIFNLRPLQVRSGFAMYRSLRSLEQLVADWRSRKGSYQPLPPQSESLRPPEIGEVTSVSIRTVRQRGQLPGLVILAAVFSGFVASIFQLPLEWLAPFRPDDASGYAGISGWYAVIISALMVVFYYGPFWFSRQPAEGQLAPVPPPPLPAKNLPQPPAS